jgi:hypothetical protein
VLPPPQPTPDPRARLVSARVIPQAAMNACDILNTRLAPVKTANPTAAWADLIAAAAGNCIDLLAEGWFSPTSSANGGPFQCVPSLNHVLGTYLLIICTHTHIHIHIHTHLLMLLFLSRPLSLSFSYFLFLIPFHPPGCRCVNPLSPWVVCVFFFFFFTVATDISYSPPRAPSPRWTC